jgi:hypothetical protein
MWTVLWWSEAQREGEPIGEYADRGAAEAVADGHNARYRLAARHAGKPWGESLAAVLPSDAAAAILMGRERGRKAVTS